MVEDDVQLIRRVLAGDEEAFTALVRKYQKSVHALAWRKIGDFHIAEEIAQDAFLQAYKNLATLRNPNQFAGWLYVIASNLCKRWHQSRKPAMQSLENTSVTEIEESSYKRHVSDQREMEVMEHRREVVKELLEKLPESERTVVTLHYLGEMTTKEIGKFLGVSVNTIKSRLRRARERLQEEEFLVRETLGSVQLSTDFIEGIMRQVADLKPASPPVGKPLLPWVAFGTAAVFILLMIGVGSQYLARFQKPYNLNAQSEITVEIIDAPVVLDTQAEPDLRNQAGRFDMTGRSRGAGPQVSEPVAPAVAQIEKDVPETMKQQWIQASGPGGGPISGLFVSSEGTTYAVSVLGIYRLTRNASAWTLVSPPSAININLSTVFNRDSMTPMAEKNGTLYLVSVDEVFISTDRAASWESLGTRPKGTAVGLAITDEALYLALRDKGVFRSEDMGKQWTLLNDEVAKVRILAVANLKNTVFVGTNQGLYRINPKRNFASGTWEKLPLNTTKVTHSLAVSKNDLYVGTGPELEVSKRETTRETLSAGQPMWEIFRSTDLGDSWTDITPMNKPVLLKMSPGVKVLTAGEMLWALGYIGFQFRSTDRGKTWTTPETNMLDFNSMMNSMMLSVLPVVGVDENTLFKAGLLGLTRSTDSGESWHPFIAGMVGSRIFNVVAFKNALYINTGVDISRSIDGGRSWKTLGFGPNELPKSVDGLDAGGALGFPKMAISDGVLYGITPILGVEDALRIFRLSFNGRTLVLIQDILAFSENLSIETSKKVPKENMADNSANDPEKASNSTNTNLQGIPREFAVSGDAFYVAYQGRLLRWRRGEPEWFDTGLVDIYEPPNDDDPNRFILAVSGETVYVGKRDGHLFRSFDSGNTWKDLTATLPFQFKHFNEIVFVGSTVHVATDAGVLTSADGENWHTLTDKAGTRTIIDRIAVVGTTIYGAGDAGVYQLDSREKWEQILPEVPNKVISIAIDGDRLYIATKRSGMFHASLKKEND